MFVRARCFLNVYGCTESVNVGDEVVATIDPEIDGDMGPVLVECVEVEIEHHEGGVVDF